MVRMDIFTLPPEFLGLSPISLGVDSALATLGRCPFSPVFLLILFCTPDLPGTQCAAQANLEFTAVLLC